jgi:hypothetical protein
MEFNSKKGITFIVPDGMVFIKITRTGTGKGNA